MIRTIAFCLLLALTAIACEEDFATPTSVTPIPADPTVTETFRGTLAVGGARFYSFSVSVYGTVNLTLTDVNGSTEATDVLLGLALGVPRGTDCISLSAATTSAGSSPQVSNAVNAGVYCARIYDTGTLAEPAGFVVTIAHP